LPHQTKIEAVEVLHLFNNKVERLERTRLAKRLKRKIPELVAKFEKSNIDQTGKATVQIVGRINSWIPKFNEDDIDAFVLTYRLLTQKMTEHQ
jgi:hypothetical protein